MANAKTPSPAKSSAAPKDANEATAPTIRKQYGRVVISTWPKTVTTADGQQRETWLSSVTREYRDGDERKRTHYLFPEDLLFAAHGLLKTFEEVWDQDRSEEQNDA